MNGKQHDIIDCLEKLPERATRRGDDNERMVLRTMDQHNRRLFPAIFSKNERQLVRKHLLAELEQGFEHRRNALSMILETRLQSVREACNHVLVTGKTHMRQQRLEYFGKVYRNVAYSMDQLSSEFLMEMDERFKNIGRFHSNSIRDREVRRLEKSVDTFLDTIDQLLEEFRNIVSENIDHHQD